MGIINIIRSAAAIAAAVVLLALTKPVSSAAYDGIIYSADHGEVIVTGYSGEPVFLEIPQFISGCPVTAISADAFSGCTTLKHISLPDGLCAIGDRSFYACSSLESAVIPDSVITLGEGCFCGCEKLSAVDISSGINALPDSCFRACVSLTDVILPDSITVLGKSCFSGCSSLRRVITGSSVTEIGDHAFYMCTDLECIYIPDTVTSIGERAIGYSGAVPDTGFMLLGSKGSAAQSYADRTHISFTAADCTAGTAAVAGISGRRLSSGIPIPYLAAVIILTPAVIIRLSIQNSRLRRRK